MTTCGGSIGVMRIYFENTHEPLQLAGPDDNRDRLHVRADRTNAAAIWLTSNRSSVWREGFFLDPGESFTFDGRGARGQLFAIATGTRPANGGTENVMVMTEGA